MARLRQDLADALRREGDEFWEVLTKRLVAYAAVLLRSRRWRGWADGVIPDGHGPESIATQAVETLFEDTEWQGSGNSYSRQELEFELKRIVHNIVRNLERRKENLIVSSEPDLSHHDDEIDGEAFFNNFDGNSPQPDGEADRHEALDLLAKFQSEFREFLGRDERLKQIFNCVCNGVVKRDDQATLLSITPQEITNGRKRLDRKLDQFAASSPHYPSAFIKEVKNA